MRSRTGGRVVEGTGLENRRTRKGIVSSNLTLSACGSSERAFYARWIGGLRCQRALSSWRERSDRRIFTCRG